MFAVLMIDIDHFQARQRHATATRLAMRHKELADVATRTLRPSDILARYGERNSYQPARYQTGPGGSSPPSGCASGQAATVISDTGAIRFTVSSRGCLLARDVAPGRDRMRRQGTLFSEKKRTQSGGAEHGLDARRTVRSQRERRSLEKAGTRGQTTSSWSMTNPRSRVAGDLARKRAAIPW